jgi:hypothetical protein
MALLTLAECKSILGIATGSTANDAAISVFIPFVERDICAYCNNYFADTVVYVHDRGSVVFVRGDTSTGTTDADEITDDEDRFSTSGFRAGMDIVVFGGSNEGIYSLASVTTGALQLTSTGEIEDQDPNASYNTVGPLLISRVKWPKALKPTAARMIWHLIDNPYPGDIQSERLDDYSVTYAGEHAYPARVLNGLRPYRRAILI